LITTGRIIMLVWLRFERLLVDYL